MEQITKLIEENEIREAIELLDDGFRKSILKRHYHSVSSGKIKGVVNRRDYEKEMNKIAMDILILADLQKK